jgi:hypothetical protein
MIPELNKQQQHGSPLQLKRTTERIKIVQWTILVKGRAGALAKNLAKRNGAKERGVCY